jgi:hypothetical protein
MTLKYPKSLALQFACEPSGVRSDWELPVEGSGKSAFDNVAVVRAAVTTFGNHWHDEMIDWKSRHPEQDES